MSAKHLANLNSNNTCNGDFTIVDGDLIANDQHITFPPNQGSADSYMRTDGKGVTSWLTPTLGKLGDLNVNSPQVLDILQFQPYNNVVNGVPSTGAWQNIPQTQIFTNPTFTGTTTVSGNLIVKGASTNLNTTTMNVSDNFITVNSGETGAGVTAGTAGIEVVRGTATNYQFEFQESDQSFRVGQKGNTQAVSTREDQPATGAMAAWNSTLSRWDTAIGLTSAEVAQLQNITSTKLSPANWGYLSTTDQNVTTTSTVQFQTVNMGSQVLTINDLETGVGVTGGTSGFKIVRGPQQTPYQILFDESLGGMRSGLATLQAVAHREDTPAAGSIPSWDSATSKYQSFLTQTQALQLKNLGNTVSATQWSYLGLMDQGVATTNMVKFNTVTATAQVVLTPSLAKTLLIPGSTSANDVYGLEQVVGNSSKPELRLFNSSLQNSLVTVGTYTGSNAFTDVFTVDTAAKRVGIMTNAPSVELDLVGAAKISKTLSVTQGATLQSTLGVTGLSTLAGGIKTDSITANTATTISFSSPVTNVQPGTAHQNTTVETLGTSVGGTTTSASVDLQTASGTATGRFLWQDDSNSSNHLVWYTKQPGNQANGLLERFRIASNGNVGIGQSSPAYTLDVAGTGNFTAALSAVGITTTTLSASSTLGVTGLSTLSGGVTTAALTASGAATFQSTSTHTGLGTFNSGIQTTGITSSGAATLQSTLGVTGTTTLQSTLGVAGATTLQSTLGVTGATTLQSTLGVTGQSTLAGLTASGTAALNGGTTTTTLGASGAVTFQTTLGVTGQSTLAALTASGAAALNGGTTTTTLGVSGAATLQSTLGVTGAATLQSTLGVTGAATLQSTLGVTGAVTVGSLTTAGTTTFNSQQYTWPSNASVAGAFLAGSTTGALLWTVPILAGLSDTTIAAPAEGDTLVYTSGKWQNKAPRYKVKTYASAVTLTLDTTMQLINVTTTTNVTLQLPSAATNAGEWFLVCKLASQTNTVTIQCAGTDTIGGASTFPITNQGDMVELVSNGINQWLTV